MSARIHLLAVGAFTVGSSGYIVSGVLPAVSRELDVSTATAGQLVTVFAIAYAIASPLLATATGGGSGNAKSPDVTVPWGPSSRLTDWNP